MSTFIYILLKVKAKTFLTNFKMILELIINVKLINNYVLNYKSYI